MILDVVEFFPVYKLCKFGIPHVMLSLKDTVVLKNDVVVLKNDQ